VFFCLVSFCFDLFCLAKRIEFNDAAINLIVPRFPGVLEKERPEPISLNPGTPRALTINPGTPRATSINPGTPRSTSINPGAPRASIDLTAFASFGNTSTATNTNATPEYPATDLTSR
jgi:hypothetical protein